MRPSHGDRGGTMFAALTDAVRRGGHRSPARPLILALGCVVVASTVAASAVPVAPTSATARARRPEYLRPVGSMVLAGLLPPPALTGDHSAVGVPPGTPAPSVGGNGQNAASAVAGYQRYQGAPGTLTPVDIATLALERGCAPAGAATASAIAMAESGGSPSAQGDIALMSSVWDWSAGLWQIRGLRAERGTGALRDSIANQQVGHNAEAMYTISLGCTDWTPWSTYTNGDYLRFLAIAEQAVTFVLAYYRAHGHYPPLTAPDAQAAIPSQGMGAASPHSGTQGRTKARPHHARPRRARSPGGRPAGSPAPASAGPSAGTGGTGGAPLPTPTAPSSTPALNLPASTTLPVPLPTSTLPTSALPTSALPTSALPSLPIP